MKGQVVFEFIFAAFILFAIVIYTINYLSINMNSFHSNFLSNQVESKAMQVSEVLMNNPKVGLVDEWPYLSDQKMSDFNLTCYKEVSYFKLLENFSMIEYFPEKIWRHMDIVVKSSNGKVYVDCDRMPSGNITKGVVTRYGLLPSNEIASVEISVW